MNPGRELDKLVGEKVMGIEHPKTLIRVNGTDDLYYPKYSTDIVEAWEVVEKIKGSRFGAAGLGVDGFAMIFLNDMWNVNYVSEGLHEGIGFDDGWAAQSSSLPHAICLAALKAMGVEV